MWKTSSGSAGSRLPPKRLGEGCWPDVSVRTQGHEQEDGFPDYALVWERSVSAEDEKLEK